MKYRIIFLCSVLVCKMSYLFAGEREDVRSERDQELYARLVEADRVFLNCHMERERKQKEEKRRAQKSDIGTK